MKQYLTGILRGLEETEGHIYFNHAVLVPSPRLHHTGVVWRGGRQQEGVLL